MNAKKIMGAVLVALLAAALFVGVASAAEYGPVSVYQTGQNTYEGTWTNGAATVIVTADGVVMPGNNFAPGTYKKGDNKLVVTYPTASYTADAKYDGIAYYVADGGKVYAGTNLKIVPTPVADGTNFARVLVTYPNGTALNITNPFNGGVIEETGTYKVQAIFNSGLAEVTPFDLLADSLNSFSFTVVEKDDATIAGSVDTVYSGQTATITVEGTPGVKYNVVLDGVTIPEDQLLVLENVTQSGDEKLNYTFQMPNTGKASFTAKIVGNDDDEGTIQLVLDGEELKNQKVVIAVSAPVVTATLGAPSYFIGEDIKITGTSTSSIDADTFTFNISGTNLAEQTLTKEETDKLKGKEWEVVLGIPFKVDVGTYTIKIYQGDKVVKTLAVALKQPFISIVEAPEVVVQDTEVEFIINAEAAVGVKAYFFGTNYFKAVPATLEDEDVANEFTVTLTRAYTDAMSAGQYFAVFQHPMYDGKFNIMVADDKKFYLNDAANAVKDDGDANTDSVALFNVTDRQTANAAQALCDALDTQNIDDMYVKYSFFVVGEDQSFTMSEIPSEIVKGDKLVISGVSTANADDTVTVEMISTAFAAVPKETVGSAAFIVVTTEVAKDGTWEVTLDTSDLNVDEYSLSVACDGADKPWKNVNINVVEGADTPDTPDTPDVPDTPDTPDTPTEPETPGFGALAALAGLGAVAVLLLRRE